MDDENTPPIIEPSMSFEAAQQLLEAQDLGDGLPLVPPTRARMDAMLFAVQQPNVNLGALMPLFGELTPAAVAYQCVLAGCDPAHLPLVVTALEACTDEHFNLLGLATTTGTPAVAVVVHGPMAEDLGFNASSNCLGPGNRANAVVGRAVALSLRNIGGAHPGIGDMATMGQPGKFGWCFAENREGLFPGFAERCGFGSGVSAVSVLGVSGTAEVLPFRQDSPEEILTPIAAAMWSSLAVAGGSRSRERCEQVILFPPELVRNLLARGWTMARAQSFLNDCRPAVFDETLGPWGTLASEPLCNAPTDIHLIVTGGPGVKITHLPLWAGGTKPVTRIVRNL